MAINAVNLAKIYSKLDRFREAERYTDVTVDCMDASFNCHRLALAAASDYFDRMFGSSFRESNEGNIALPTINGATFEQFLNFVYTGNVVVNSSNICDLLEVSEFLQSSGMQDILGVQFIKQNDLTMQNAVDLFAFARATGKKDLSTILGCHIADQLDIFGKIERFLDVSFDDLKFILDCQSPSSSQKADSLVGTFARWTHRHQGEVLGPQYLEELLKLVKFENISAEYMKYALGKFIEDPENNTLTQFEKPIGYSETSELSKNVCQEANTLLHVFVEHKYDDRVRVFSINKDLHCSITADVSETELKYRYHFKSVSDDSHWYGFSRTSLRRQKFHAYSSISMCPKVRLRNPPIKFDDSVMCASPNNIYVYNSCLAEKATRVCASPSTTSFNNKEINRGILVYNLEIDNWFPVPKMKKKLQGAGVAVCEGSLFVIGGVNCVEESAPGYAQALDCRTGEWRKLPKTYAEYCGAACCAIEGKLYVCGGGGGFGNEAERYDPVAGKWEKIAPTNKRWQYHKVVNYSNQMWAMSNFDFDEDPADLSIEIYNPKSNKWNSFLALQEEADKANFSASAILDAVVFK